MPFLKILETLGHGNGSIFLVSRNGPVGAYVVLSLWCYGARGKGDEKNFSFLQKLKANDVTSIARIPRTGH